MAATNSQAKTTQTTTGQEACSKGVQIMEKFKDKWNSFVDAASESQTTCMTRVRDANNTQVPIPSECLQYQASDFPELQTLYPDKDASSLIGVTAFSFLQNARQDILDKLQAKCNPLVGVHRSTPTPTPGKKKSSSVENSALTNGSAKDTRSAK